MDAIQAAEPISGTSKKPNLFRVAVATVVGTAVEAFDFLAYGTAAALVFNKLFFPQFDPVTGTLAAFGAFASGMLARPIGGLIFGHFGDRIGRKSMLTLSLLLMGICTVLIGLLRPMNRSASRPRCCWSCCVSDRGCRSAARWEAPC